jgi:hypothetical protein
LIIKKDMKKAPVAKKPVAAKAPAPKAAPKAPSKPATKKEEKKVEEAKVEEAKDEEPTPVVEEAIPEPVPPKEPVLGKVVVKFNHYNESFPIIDGVLKWKDIDEEYCFSTVYETGFFLAMWPEESKDSLMEIRGHTFRGCQDGATYVVEAKEAEKGAPGAFVEGEGVEEPEEEKA